MAFYNNIQDCQSFLTPSSQVVLSVCLLPYHIFKPIFISLANDQQTNPPDSECHPLNGFVEVTKTRLYSHLLLYSRQ